MPRKDKIARYAYQNAWHQAKRKRLAGKICSYCDKLLPEEPVKNLSGTKSVWCTMVCRNKRRLANRNYYLKYKANPVSRYLKDNN